MKIWKKHVRIMAVAIIGLVVVSIAGTCTTAEGKSSRRAKEKKYSVVGKEYYTMANIWYEHPKKILSTNFHRGNMIPVGTKVVINRLRGVKIKFTVVETEGTFTYFHAKKHSKIKLRELFERYFSKEDPMRPGGHFEKFTEKEKENIMDGTLANGMSKEAVLMTYGYPPTHRTPSLATDVWTYWKGRAGRFLVVFKDDQINDIQY